MDDAPHIYTSRHWTPPEEPAGRFEDVPSRAAPQSRPAKVAPQMISAAALMRKKFAPVQYVVPGYVAEGCTLLAGAPKLGKSWLALEWAIAKATGGQCMGSVQTGEPGDTLYLALEDNERRLQSRMDRLLPFGSEGPERLTLATKWARADQGGLGDIRTWAQGVAKPRLIIIDVLAAFRQPTSPKGSPYEQDYQAVKALTELASELGVAIVAVLHTRKSREQVDPFDRVSGTLGLSGAADTALILDRDGQGVTIYGRGRDIPEVETAMQFNKDACRWSVQGRAAEVHQSDERKAVIDVLLVTAEPMTPVTIAEATGRPRNNIKQLLFKMLHKGEVVKAGKGAYVHPSRTDLLMSTPDNRDNQ